MSMGLRIKSLRKAKKLSQQALAKKAKVSQPVISSYENDTVQEHRSHVLLKIAAALETTLEYLVTGEGELCSHKVKLSESEFEAIFNSLSAESQAALLVVVKAMAKLP